MVPTIHTSRISPVILLSAMLCAGDIARAQSAGDYHDRADRALATFLVRFWNEGGEYLRHEFDGESSTGYWTFAQGFDALLDGVERTGGERFAGLIETFYEAQAMQGWNTGWYDDENWMALALIRAHDLTGRQEYLEVARSLYDDIRGGWDASCCGEKPGGIWWDRWQTQKATAANGGPVITGVRLAARTGAVEYLDFARQVYEYWFENMVIPGGNGYQVIDHIETDGNKVSWKFTYNEGLMMGAAVELHRATGEDRYLDHARKYAAFMIGRETDSSIHGRVLSDGSNSSCTGDCHAFKGPAYRYLSLLFEETLDPAYEAVLAASAESIWNNARNSKIGLFSVCWTGPAMTAFSEPQTCAAVMALNLDARRRGGYPGTGAPPGRLEAEDGALRRMDIAFARQGFTGWGYLAGDAVDGARVLLRTKVEEPGPRQIVLRYAATAGAIRTLEVPGASFRRTIDFAASGGWALRVVTADLPAGSWDLLVEARTGDGSAGRIEIDSVTVRPVPVPFLRGDANADGATDLGDALAVLLALFGGSPVTCEKAADAGDDGAIDISDPIRILEHLFLSGPAPAPPSVACGADPTEDLLDCPTFHPCR